MFFSWRYPQIIGISLLDFSSSICDSEVLDRHAMAIVPFPAPHKPARTAGGGENNGRIHKKTGGLPSAPALDGLDAV
jgi:hypothetical protein